MPAASRSPRRLPSVQIKMHMHFDLHNWASRKSATGWFPGFPQSVPADTPPRVTMSSDEFCESYIHIGPKRAAGN
jgi:hypothetical protein